MSVMMGFTMTLVDNSGATDLVLPEGRFDRYYIEFDSDIVTSVQLDGADETQCFCGSPDIRARI